VEEGRGRGKRNYGVRAVSSILPAAGWQRLNDLPNNKSSRRYDRTRRGPSLGTRELLTSPLRPKATTLRLVSWFLCLAMIIFDAASRDLRHQIGKDLWKWKPFFWRRGSLD